MKNIKYYLKPETEEKILHKHGIKIEELNEALKYGKPRIRKIRDNIYMTVTYYTRYITIIFEYENPNGKITTAYPSDDWQIRIYNKN